MPGILGVARGCVEDAGGASFLALLQFLLIFRFPSSDFNFLVGRLSPGSDVFIGEARCFWPQKLWVVLGIVVFPHVAMSVGSGTFGVCCRFVILVFGFWSPNYSLLFFRSGNLWSVSHTCGPCRHWQERWAN